MLGASRRLKLGESQTGEGTACWGRDWWPLVGLKWGPGTWVWQGEACCVDAGQGLHGLAVLALLSAQLALIFIPPTFVHPLTCLTPCFYFLTVLPLQ